jgi:Na+/H+ antiporter NhaD/arsenite permease-like protein
MSTSAIVLLVAVPLIVWRLYSRIRRLIGKQRSSLRRHWLVALFFPIIAILLMFANLASPLGLGGLLLGLAVGVALAIWGLKLTKFERAGEQFFYTPDSRIGIFIILLFIGRLGYRLLQMVTLTGDAAQTASVNFSRSPLTTVIFGVLAGFYCCYSIGLIRWRKSTGATN